MTETLKETLAETQPGVVTNLQEEKTGITGATGVMTATVAEGTMTEATDASGLLDVTPTEIVGKTDPGEKTAEVNVHLAKGSHAAARLQRS